MAYLFNRTWSRAELMKQVGDLSQIAGIKLGEWSDGSERGLRVADVRSGSGLGFTVLLDRGMDIGPATYKGCRWHGSPQPDSAIRCISTRRTPNGCVPLAPGC